MCQSRILAGIEQSRHDGKTFGPIGQIRPTEYALFYTILRFVQGTRGFGHVQLMNNTLLEML